MNEVHKTKNYDQFKFRTDNRAALNQAHIRRLAESIKARNLLDWKPISVNAQMEVIDGQHRLLAAKMLGVEIYYQMNKELSAQDIIIMNVAERWKQIDYLNYYCKNDYPEYKKLYEFMKKHAINIKIALKITMDSPESDRFGDFRSGKYKFNMDAVEDEMETCNETIQYIKKMNGASTYTQSARFWTSLLKLVRHSNFDKDKWRENMKKMIQRFTVKVSQEDYLKLYMEVHNWRNNVKVGLIEYGD